MYVLLDLTNMHSTFGFWVDHFLFESVVPKERSEYRRVDATLMLLAANDTNVRRLWISPGLAVHQ